MKKIQKEKELNNHEKFPCSNERLDYITRCLKMQI